MIVHSYVSHYRRVSKLGVVRRYEGRRIDSALEDTVRSVVGIPTHMGMQSEMQPENGCQMLVKWKQLQTVLVDYGSDDFVPWLGRIFIADHGDPNFDTLW